METLKDTLITGLGILLLVLIIGVAIWANAAAPCDSFAYTRAADLPGRCVMQEGN